MVTATLASSKLFVDSKLGSVTIANTNKTATDQQYYDAGLALQGVTAFMISGIYRINESTLEA